MSRTHVVICACALAAVSACDPIAIAEITVALRQPTDRDLIEEADAIALESLLDGRDVGKEVEQPTAEKLAFSIELAPPEGGADEPHSFVTTLRGRVGAPGDATVIALGRSPAVTLPSAAELRETGAAAKAVRLPVLFGPTDAPATLVAALPEIRSEAAVCANAAGRAWVLGGRSGAVAVNSGYVFDEQSLDLSDARIELADNGWTEGDCLIDADGEAILFGGCTAAGASLNYLHRIVDGAPRRIFGFEDIDAGCGARLRHGPSGDFWLVTDTSAVLRQLVDDDEGLVVGVAYRRGGSAATTEGGDLILSRGVDMADNPLTGAIGVHAENGLVFPLADVGGAALLDFRGERAPYALGADGRLFVIVRAGQSFDVDEVRTIELGGIVPDLLVPLPGDRLAVLGNDQAGLRRLLFEAEGGGVTSLETARDRMAVGPGGSLLLFGGDLPGIDVVVPP